MEISSESEDGKMLDIKFVFLTKCLAMAEAQFHRFDLFN